MNSKTNEILNEVILTATQAILCDDEAIKRQAIGDIIDALASVIPSERIYKRKKNNKRLREGVLTPEEELADTIARQKEEA